MSEAQEGLVADLSRDRLGELLRSGALGLRTGPLLTRVRAALPDVAASIHVLYGGHPFVVDPDFADLHVSLAPPPNLRRWLRPQVQFFIDGEAPFEPLPRDQAPAFLEWGMNWSIAASCHQWFTLHGACLERSGGALILPAPPGSGKSTLCAALALRGWRLLSDELTLLDPASLAVQALARPINLKNASIDIIRRFEPDTVWAPETYDTAKGRVTHLRPPVESVRRMGEAAEPRWIVFPRYQADAEPLLTPKDRVQTFVAMTQNAFNYSVLGEAGFTAVAGLVDRCRCYDFVYSRLADALEVFDWLATGGER